MKLRKDSKYKRFAQNFVKVLAVLGLVVGVYLLINTLSPALPIFETNSKLTEEKLFHSQPNISENRIYVPSINIDVPVVDINGNENLALEKGAVNRSPSSGNPRDGGNYVVAAHRFNIGLTPTETRAKSPFYNMDKIKSGDQIFIDFSGKRYAYEVFDRKTVAPDAVSIEESTKDSRLTMYSCELAGPKAGREVILAKLVGTVVWVDGKQVIEGVH